MAMSQSANSKQSVKSATRAATRVRSWGTVSAEGWAACLRDLGRWAVGAWFVLFVSAASWAQIGRYPAPGYYVLQGQESLLHAGEFRTAERAIQNLYRGGYREGNQRWVDSSAYLALLGETRYQAGDYVGAMQAFDEAIEIYSSVVNWGARVTWDSQPIVADANAVRVARVTWGTPTRSFVIGRFPSSFSVRFGQDIIVPGERGNTLIPQERLVPVDVIELYRAMAWVIRRRDQILGTLSQVDTPARTLRTQLSEVRSAIPGALPTAFGSVLYGISLTGEGDYQRANSVLEQALQINGFDHPLTPITLLHMGYNLYLAGDYRSAKALLLEASYSAGIFNQFDVFREALVLTGRAHMAVNRDQPLPELEAAFEWARVRGQRLAQAQFAMTAAENAIENGDLPTAVRQLGIATGLMRTNDMKRSELALRLQVLEQTVACIDGTAPDLMSLRAALIAYRPATPWVFQIELLVNPARRRNLTTTNFTKLIERVLRDPTQSDWDRDPFECLAYLTGDRSQFLAEALADHLNKRDYNAALQAAENLRRVQFYSNLPLGGRLMSFRELLARSPDELSQELRRKQAELRSRFVGFKQLLDQAEPLLAKLQTQPLDPPGAEKKAWEDEVERLGLMSRQIERQLLQVSVRREAIPLMFPPPVDMERIQALIPSKTLCLVTVFHNNIYYFLLVTNDRVVYQAEINQANAGRAIRGLAKNWGHTNPTAILQTQVVTDQTWKKPSYALLKALMPKVTPEFWDSFDELVVVPAGLFWYLPFETFALGDEPEAAVLVDKVAVRYAPSLNLAFNEQRPKRLNRVIHYPNKIDQRDDDAWVKAARAELERHWPQVTPIESTRLPTESLGPLVNVVLYWNEIKQAVWPEIWTTPESKRDAHLQLNLDRWIGFPNVGPELLVVAGGNSAMADGLRGNPSGAELEYYSTVLLAAGCQSVVLPRWRTGGHVPYDLHLALTRHVREHTTAVAMQKAIQEIRQAPLDLQRQTRLRPVRGEAPATADHPFWWAGQMVIDRGSWYRDPEGRDLPVRDLGEKPQLQLGGDQEVGGDQGLGGDQIREGGDLGGNQ
jgi:tetratricopeptide (TPR) repeat protein